METTLNKAAPLIQSFVEANVPVNLIGSPGVGKSDIIKEVARKMNLKVIDFRLSTADPTDLSGLPFMNDGRAVYLPNEAFPLESDTLPIKGHRNLIGEDGKPMLNADGTPQTEPVYFDGWLLFLDEITNAPMSVQAAAYKLILDREVGLHKLNSKVKIVSAGNKTTDGAAVVAEMSTALKSRMAHINIIHSLDVWLEWAIKNGVHHSITSFLQFMITEFYRFDPKDKADTYPCPRTWGMADKMVQTMGMGHSQLQDALSAVLSDGTATNYANFIKNFANLPSFADIIADPKNTEVPNELSARFALSGSIGAQTTKENVDAVMDYLERLPSEFQLCTFNEFTKRSPTTVSNPKVRAWLKKNAPQMIED